MYLLDKYLARVTSMVPYNISTEVGCAVCLETHYSF